MSCRSRKARRNVVESLANQAPGWQPWGFTVDPAITVTTGPGFWGAGCRITSPGQRLAYAEWGIPIAEGCSRDSRRGSADVRILRHSSIVFVDLQVHCLSGMAQPDAAGVCVDSDSGRGGRFHLDAGQIEIAEHVAVWWCPPVWSIHISASTHMEQLRSTDVAGPGQ